VLPPAVVGAALALLSGVAEAVLDAGALFPQATRLTAIMPQRAPAAKRFNNFILFLTPLNYIFPESK
jgi:hypothetical protein